MSDSSSSQMLGLRRLTRC